jgi:hypothetical protein
LIGVGTEGWFEIHRTHESVGVFGASVEEATDVDIIIVVVVVATNTLRCRGVAC